MRLSNQSRQLCLIGRTLRSASATVRCLFGVAISGLAISAHFPAAAQTEASSACPAALAQMQSYRTASGDTLTSIAETYRLLPATLSRFNPGVSSSPPAGTALVIPPFNGTVVSANAGETWQSLAKRYGNQAEVLFEVNGCTSQLPSRIFIPGGLTVAGGLSQVSLPGYPLARRSPMALSYGWQPDSTQDELVFNSGIAFTISAPTDVLAVDSGTVAFAGDRPGYGNLVVINHAQGLQTRYANLRDISVSVGQTIASTSRLGSVGDDTSTYLYFEVRKNSASGWVAEDPARYLPALELR